jgi:hypothetical protein
MTRRYSDFSHPRDVASLGDHVVMAVAALIFSLLTIGLVYSSAFITAILNSMR